MRSIDALRRALAGGDPSLGELSRPDRTFGFDYAVWRFLHAWRGNPLGPDHAVLLRQIARWQPDGLFLGIESLPEPLNYFGSLADVALAGGMLTSTAFAPSWLSDISANSGDVDGRPESRRIDESVPAEGFVSALGYSRWHSLMQKEAAWTALTAPVRSTILLGLPTGAGKSLCFQIATAFSAGLTIVVVPTVALAIDQWRSAKSVFANLPSVNPIYFASDDPHSDPSAVRNLVKSGQTRLLFTSPEGCISGRLRAVLEEAAELGRVANLVFDEAHMIETWGAYFRVDFQMLSILRRKWLRRPECKLRTFLLSATVTPECRKVLKQLYWDEGTIWRECVGQRLRPEMQYFFRVFADAEQRDMAVIESAWRLPRPAIFYTTEVREAKALYRVLREKEGFNRVGCFNGETPAGERRSLLDRWRSDQIDLMVATSAFGLGVDKEDIRSIVHSCYPENLHRYYQEVGRGGRDGATVHCLLLPTLRDKRVAKGLFPKLMKPETLQKRWEGLWRESKDVAPDDHIYDLPLSAKPFGLLGARTFSEHVRWNKRLILQLLRAKKLTLLDVRYEDGPPDEEDSSEWAKVQLHFSPASAAIGESIKDERLAELEGMATGFSSMEAYLRGDKCIGRLLRDIYGKETVLVCGGCPACRRLGRRSALCPPLPRLEFETRKPDLVVIAHCPDPQNADGALRWRSLVRRMIQERSVRRFACEMRMFEEVRTGFEMALKTSEFLSFYRLDSLEEGSGFGIWVDESVVIFHLSRLNEAALRFKGGRRVIHMLGEGISYLDSNGRRPLESDGAAFYVRPELWPEGE